MSRMIAIVVVIATMASLGSNASGADAYPSKPIRVIVPYSAGGGTDLVGRALQPRLEAALGGSMMIDNRPSGGGILGVNLVAKAPADGYTLLLNSASFTFIPSMYKELPFDAIKDFRPITNLARTPLILCVHPSMPVTRLKDLLDIARKHPGDVLYASAGVGSNLHLTTELFKYMAGIDMRAVPYKGAGTAAIGLMTGEVQVSFLGLMAAVPLMNSGRMRGLAVSTKERSPILPDMPSIHEAGVPGYDKGGWTGLYAPAAVPDPIIRAIYQAAAKVTRDPETAKLLAGQGSTLVGNTPEDFAVFVRAEIAEWAKLIQKMNLPKL
jgi:tripartite-type tricarboxylate transporter receptor subunit TctC